MFSLGGRKSKSRTSGAYSGKSEATTYSNLVFCVVMFRVENYASSCANHNCGSAGSLTAMATRAGVPSGSLMINVRQWSGSPNVVTV